MGTKVHSLFVRCTDPHRVAESLGPLAQDADMLELALVPSGRWTIVLGDELDDLDGVAHPLSSALGAPVVHTRVVDGEAAQMRLLIDGEEVGWLATPPRSFKRRKIGDIGPWRALLDSDAAAVEMEGAWRDPDTRIEERVAIAARHLGIEHRIALENLYALERDYPGRIDLSFELAEPEPVAGPPRLAFTGGSLDVEELAVGERIEIFSRIANMGGGGHGARLTIGGAALEAGLVAIDAISVPTNDGWRRIHGRATRGTNVELDIPLSPGRWVVNVQVNAHAVAPGEGELTMSLAPKVGLAGSRTIRVTSFAQGWRPLHAVKDPAALRGLWRPDALHAWILLDESRERALDIAVEGILRFDTLLRLPDNAVYRRFSAAPGARYRQGTVPASKLTQRAIRTWMRDASRLALTLGQSTVNDAVTIDLLSVPAERQPEHAVPHLGFTIAMTGRTNDEIAALEAELVSLVDHIASRAQVRQAFVDRWSGVGPFEANGYERACGIDGQCTTLSWWVDRWLRSASQHLWIGPRLMKRIKADAVSRVADTHATEHGALRVTTDRAQISSVEKVLAPLLPDARAWDRGMKRLYGR